MKIKIELVLDVGETPTADAISYFIDQYGLADGDDTHSPEEWAEEVVLDIISVELREHDYTNGWRVENSFVEALDQHPRCPYCNAETSPEQSTKCPHCNKSLYSRLQKGGQ